MCSHDGSQGPLSADFVAEELKAKSVYILDDRELYGLGVATAFKKHKVSLRSWHWNKFVECVVGVRRN